MLDPVVGISVEIPKLAARLTSQLAAKRLAAGLLNNWHTAIPALPEHFTAKNRDECGKLRRCTSRIS